MREESLAATAFQIWADPRLYYQLLLCFVARRQRRVFLLPQHVANDNREYELVSNVSMLRL